MAANLDDLRRASAGSRRALVIETFSREFDVLIPTSTASRFAELLDRGPRLMIVSADIDGLVSASMLARVAPAWKIAALVWRNGAVDVHSEAADQAFPLEGAFGVDIFSALFDNVSNHPQFWGSRRVAGSAGAIAAAQAYDRVLRERSDELVFINPSIWAGIEGSQPGEWRRPTSTGYRYPLGSAQVLLAILETIGRSPRMFDRQYLPLLIAHCDGGLDSFRDYPFNVPLWWSSMAAAVGPASLTESLYQLAANQRPTELPDAVNRLLSEGRDEARHVSKFLDNKWNLRLGALPDIGVVSRWITNLSGWPDPFLGGADNLSGWVRTTPPSGVLRVGGLPAGGETEFKSSLRASLNAVHTNFNSFDGNQRLSWVSPWPACLPPNFAPLPPELT